MALAERDKLIATFLILLLYLSQFSQGIHLGKNNFIARSDPDQNWQLPQDSFIKEEYVILLAEKQPHFLTTRLIETKHRPIYIHPAETSLQSARGIPSLNINRLTITLYTIKMINFFFASTCTRRLALREKWFEWVITCNLNCRPTIGAMHSSTIN